VLVVEKDTTTLLESAPESTVTARQSAPLSAELSTPLSITAADLTLRLSASVISGVVGTPVSFTATYANSGSVVASGVVVSVEVPGQITATLT
jgi:hypothetical protein